MVPRATSPTSHNDTPNDGRRHVSLALSLYHLPKASQQFATQALLWPAKERA